MIDKIRNLINKNINVLISLIVSISLTLHFNFVDYINIWYLVVLDIIIILFQTFIINKVLKNIPIIKDKYILVISNIVSIFLCVGNIYASSGTIKSIFSISSFLLLIIKIYGFNYYVRIWYSIVICFYTKFEKIKIIKFKFLEIFNKHPYLFCMTLIMLSLSIYYVIYYPCIIDTDPIFQIIQFLNNKVGGYPYVNNLKDILDYSNHYPIFHTMLLGYFFYYGRILVNDNFGLFMYTLIQGFFFAYTYSRTIVFFKKRNVRIRYLLFMLFFYMITPMYGFYVLDLNKDVYYSFLIAHLVMNIFDFVEDNIISIKRFIILFINLLLLCLFRNNGIYICLLTLPFLIIYSKKQIKYFFIILLILVSGIYYSYKNILLPALNVKQGSIRETLSIPFQQTARYAFYYDDEVTKEEKEIINKILDYNTIKRDYNPVISDPVKITYKDDCLLSDKIEYFKVWFKQGIKHPLVYLDATLNNTFGYIYPYSFKFYVYYSEYPKLIFNTYNWDFHFTSNIMFRKILFIYSTAFVLFPILRLISNIGFTNIFIIIMGIYLLKEKEKRKYILALIPLYITYLICFASPVNNYFRYAMPCVFLMPFLIVMLIYIIKKRIK